VALLGSTPAREVVAGDFLQGQEAVALAAVFDEGGFQGRLKARDAALVDVGLLLFLRRLFDVDVVQGLAVDGGDAQFFRLRRVDEHSLHCAFLARCRTRNAGAFASGYRGATAHPCRRAMSLLVFQRFNTTAGRGSACCCPKICGAGGRSGIEPSRRTGRCSAPTSDASGDARACRRAANMAAP
jgi:hypothetical protein